MRGGKLDPMAEALEEAGTAGRSGEVPVGAVIVSGGEVIARAGNRTLALKDPTAHAEILAIRVACAELGTERLIGCDIYVTLEPCAMCAAAISFARLRRLYWGAPAIRRAGRSSMVRGCSPSRPATICRNAMAAFARAMRHGCSRLFCRQAIAGL